jgi:hypothetical protein
MEKMERLTKNTFNMKNMINNLHFDLSNQIMKSD